MEGPEALLRRDDVEVWHADWQALLDVLPRRDDGTVADALIVDAPYSERTHSGHDGGTLGAERVRKWSDGKLARGETRHSSGQRVEVVAARAERHGTERRTLSYPAWSAEDVGRFVGAHAPLISGWCVSLTDHVLAPAWEAAMERAGRYVFAPIACVEPGSRVRMVGDGHSQWSTWAVISRPSDGAWLDRWRSKRRAMGLGCSLDGAYVVPKGQGEACVGSRSGRDVRVVGAKPLWLMEALVRDHAFPGETVLDPCCGGGTTVLAALRTGRRAIGGDAMREHAEMTARRVTSGVQTPLLGVE